MQAISRLASKTVRDANKLNSLLLEIGEGFHAESPHREAIVDALCDVRMDEIDHLVNETDELTCVKRQYADAPTNGDDALAIMADSFDIR